jgi:prevent-host-death family protein
MAGLTGARFENYYGHKNIPEVDMEGAQKIIPVTQAKKELLEIVKEMAEEDITVAVTKNGVPVSVLMSADRYGSLLETIEILADRSVVRALARSSREFQAGKVITHDKAWAEP